MKHGKFSTVFPAAQPFPHLSIDRLADGRYRARLTGATIVAADSSALMVSIGRWIKGRQS